MYLRIIAISCVALVAAVHSANALMPREERQRVFNQTMDAPPRPRYWIEGSGKIQHHYYNPFNPTQRAAPAKQYNFGSYPRPNTSYVLRPTTRSQDNFGSCQNCATR